MTTSTSYDELPREELILALKSRDQQLLAQSREHNQEVERLYHLLVQARKSLYGKKSEKLSDPAQAELFIFAPETESPSATTANEEPVEPVIEVAGHSRKARVKRPIPEWIEREKIVYDLDCQDCSSCSKPMGIIGEEISEELEFVPATFKLIQHVRVKRACSSCKSGVFMPALPPEVKPLERRMAGGGLLAQICISKYQDHNPLYRQEQIFKRHGMELPRRLLCLRSKRSATCSQKDGPPILRKLGHHSQKDGPPP